MVQIPSFLNINDFFGGFLAGYVAATLYIVLFEPQFLLSPDQSITSDLFAAVVFIVAGPTVGFAVRHIHRQALVTSSKIWSRMMKHRSRYGNQPASTPTPFEEESEIRANATDAERLELDRSEANYDFKISVSIVLLLLPTYHLSNGAPFNIIHLLLYITAIIFLGGGVMYYHFFWLPYFLSLSKKYKGDNKRPVQEDNELTNMLKLRLATGEITTDQYEELKKVIESRH